MNNSSWLAASLTFISVHLHCCLQLCTSCYGFIVSFRGDRKLSNLSGFDVFISDYLTVCLPYHKGEATANILLLNSLLLPLIQT